ncbi:hypothetical protein niasHT_005251 [Heterodera trifolii]|uniref:Uncharacterized protein n=1 Tax=Heterodera trifolii TaxID=157864 RepID=A0ABD2LS03_9BILA
MCEYSISSIQQIIALLLCANLQLSSLQALYGGGPTNFPLFNSYVPSFVGFAPPAYALTSYSMGGFKFQGTNPPADGGGGGGSGGAAPQMGRGAELAEGGGETPPMGSDGGKSVMGEQQAPAMGENRGGEAIPQTTKAIGLEKPPAADAQPMAPKGFNEKKRYLRRRA